VYIVEFMTFMRTSKEKSAVMAQPDLDYHHPTKPLSSSHGRGYCVIQPELPSLTSDNTELTEILDKRADIIPT